MNDVLRTILSLSVSGSILALILFMGKPLLKDKVSKAFSYYIWLLVLLRLVVPISAPVNVINTLLHFEQSSLSDVLPEQTGSSVVNSTDQNAGLSTVASDTQAQSSQEQYEAADAQTSAETQQTVSLWRIIQGNLLWLWLAGAVISFGWFSVAYAVFSRHIRRSCTAPHGGDLAVFESLRGRMRVRLFCSSCAATPMSIGILRPIIVLPQRAYVHDGMSEELRNILRHEMTHCRRRDVLYKWLVVAVTSLHWFNPLMILVRKEIGRACELSCDEAVIKDMAENERQFYGNTLLTFSAGGKLPAGILATTLCEGKEQLKERLITIKHYKQKSTLVVALTLMLALLLTGCAVALGVASGGADDTGDTADSLDATIYAQGIDGMVVSHNAGNSYYLDDNGTVCISYNNGETVAEAPLTLDSDDLYDECDIGFFISEAVTAIAYGGDDAPIQVLISCDMGQTWNTYSVEGSESMGVNRYIGFVTEDDGWLVASSGSAAGMSYNYVFRTSDGGKTWTQTGNPNELYAHNITGAGFATADIAFLSFRVDSDPGPTIYWTQDGGATWAQVEVTVPEEYDYNIPLSPFFSGADGIYPIQCKTSDNGDYITYYLTSDDFGRMWTYDANMGEDDASDMSQYLTYTLPDNLENGAFNSELGYLGGSLFCWKDTGSSDAAGESESTPVGWNAYGGVEIYYNLDCSFDNGELTTVSLPWNHSAYLSDAQPLDGCASPALIVQVSHDLYTAAEAEEYGIDEDQRSSTMWYVFFAEQDSDISYALYMNADYYSEEDMIALARSAVFKDGAFDIEVEIGLIGEETSSDSGQSGQIDDGESWLVQRDDYEVGLRNQGDQTEILLRRNGAVTVLDSVPANSDTSMQYSLRSFDAIPELSGFVLENLTSYGWGEFYYYAVQNDSAVCFAQSFGEDMTDVAKDLDGDGQAELICTVTYNADGVSDVWVYRMKDGVPQVASVKDAMLNIPADKILARPASATYDAGTGSVTLEYLIAGEDDSHVETAPIDYDSLQFEDFNYTETW